MAQVSLLTESTCQKSTQESVAASDMPLFRFPKNGNGPSVVFTSSASLERTGCGEKKRKPLSGARYLQQIDMFVHWLSQITQRRELSGRDTPEAIVKNPRPGDCQNLYEAVESDEAIVLKPLSVESI